MDLSAPLRSLAPSLESSVLEVLAGTESGLSGSQIARLARRGTRAGHRPVLDRLVEHGLVDALPSNTGPLYRLNRDHVLAPVVLGAVRARRSVMDRLTSQVKALDPEPVSVVLFGSLARGQADQDSDIDVLIVVPDDLDRYASAWTEQVDTLADQVQRWTGNRLELLVLGRTQVADLPRHDEPVMHSLLTDGVILTGQDLRALIDQAPATGAVR